LPCAALELRIVDCDGVTRASQRVDPATRNRVEVEVRDSSGQPANGQEVSVTNATTGQIVTATALNGVVVFPELAPGVWSMTSSASGLVFSSVAIGADLTLAAASAALGGAVLVGGGVTVGVVEVVDQIDGGSSNDQGVPTPLPTMLPTPLPTPLPCNCDPDEDAPELDEDDFFKQNTAAASSTPVPAVEEPPCPNLGDEPEPVSPLS